MTYKQVDQVLRRLGNYRVKRAQEIALEGEPDGISGSLLLAIGCRESMCQNINNSEQTDHGCFQISERWHPHWLSTHPGCPEGSWHADYRHTAYEDKYCPTFTDGARYAVQILRNNIEAAIDYGVPTKDQVRFAIAAYNAGPGGAIKGYREGDVDKYTTGGDYSEWVLARRTTINRWLGNHKTWRFS